MQNGVAFCGSPIKGWNKEWQSSVAETTRPANLPRLPAALEGNTPRRGPECQAIRASYFLERSLIPRIPTRAVAFMLAGFHVGFLGCLKFRLIEH